MAFDHKSLDAARRVEPPDFAVMKSVDKWFPMLGLPETRQGGAPGMWTARATWRADRMIWRNPECEAMHLRMCRLMEAAERAGREEQAGRIFRNIEAFESYAEVQWPEGRPHGVTVDFAGDILCDGMDRLIWKPLDFIALAKGYRTEVGTFDTDRALKFVERADMAWNSAGDLHGLPIPPREWVVDGLVPDKTATLLTGDGGTGKSLLALQLAVSVATGANWIGHEVEKGPVLYLSAEDDSDELHRRLASIATAENFEFPDMRDLYIRSTVGMGALLAERIRVVNALHPTALAKDIEKTAKLLGVRMIVLDTLANLFPGDENDRAQVTQFVDIVKGIGLRCGCAMVVLAHPSKSAMESGEGYSGNTAWNAAVRSRLFFRRVIDGGYEADPNARVLRTMKSNYGPVGNEIGLTYSNGVFVPVEAETSLDRKASTARAERVFLSLLSLLSSQGRKVNHAGGQTYAPNVFAKHPQSDGVTKRAFAAAMETLLASGRIRVSEDGPASKRRQFLEVSE